MRLVNIESPYAPHLPKEAGEGEWAAALERNLEYARACMKDSLSRGEAPIASHLLYTQPGILDDTVPEEREQGIRAGLAWNQLGDATVVYTDLGVSRGMQLGVENAELLGRPVEYRKLGGKWEGE